MSLKINSSYTKIIKQNAQQWLIDSHSEVECAFWARANEHTIKLCLLLADNLGNCPAFSAMYAWQLVEHLTLNLIRHCQEGICDNAGERQSVTRAKKFKNLILPNEMITQSQLTRRASNRGFSKAERLSRTQDLLEAGEWVHKAIENPESFRKVDYFHRSENQNSGFQNQKISHLTA